MNKKKYLAGLKYGYRSGLEVKVADQLKDLNIKFTYEETKIFYEVPSRFAFYHPDFCLVGKNEKTIFAQSKER